MKKVMVSRLLSIMLILSILLSMAACGTKDSPTETTSGNSTTAAVSESTKVVETPDPFGKYDPTITLTAVRDTLTDFKFPDGDDISNNVWTREIESTLGIKIKYNWTIDMSQYENKLNVSIASGDIPDFFSCSPSTFKNLAANGQLADLTEVYEKYATPEFKATMDSFPEGFEAAKFDGKLMAISQQGYGVISMPPVVWLRDDWMKKFNLAPPQSMADLEKIAETFVTQDPDGNKKNDTYGVGLYKDYFGGLEAVEGIANAHHAYPGIWIKDATGKIVYGSVQPEMKNTLQTLQNWYKKGILSKEFGSKDYNKVNEDIVSGKVGIEFGACWNGFWPFADLVKKDVNAIFKPYAIPSSDSNAVYLQAGWPVPGVYVVNKNCKNPEAIVKMCNLFNKLSQSSEEDYYKFISTKEGNQVYKFTPLYPSDPAADYKSHVLIAEALKTRDASKLNVPDKALYDTILGWVDKKDPAGYGGYMQKSSEGAYAILKKHVDEKQVKLNELHGIMPTTLAEKNATLLKLEQDAYTKIIYGGSMDEFDKFVENWNKLGGEQITKEMNEIYNSK